MNIYILEMIVGRFIRKYGKILTEENGKRRIVNMSMAITEVRKVLNSLLYYMQKVRSAIALRKNFGNMMILAI